jgi:hypothetical protein
MAAAERADSEVRISAVLDLKGLGRRVRLN